MGQGSDKQENPMSHNIGQMFYFGKRPWHTLGTRLARPANVLEALAAGGLNWEVDLVPVVPVGEPDSEVAHRVAVVRKDRAPGEPGRVIGVVHPGFVPLQNRQGAMMLDALLGQGKRVYHTGGYLKQGEVIWLLARMPHDIRVRGKDVLETYLLFTNSHDGSVGIDIRLTTVRVVCQNTLSLALSKKATGKIFQRAHNGRYGLLRDEAKRFFEFATKQSKEAETLFSRLASERCEDSKFHAFLGQLMPDPRKPVSALTNRAVLRGYETRMETVRATRKLITDIHRFGIPGEDIPPAESTWWGALNTITGWVDHVQETDSDRYAHILMGAGDRIKSVALELIRSNAAFV
jgi:phage/plasmid-like protein (TIGR03299 family)